MARVEKSVDVAVPVTTAYNQWTQFEEFPRFMDGVQEVQQLDDRRLHWKAELGGRFKEWDAEIREQVPDQKIIWQSLDGSANAGQVVFEPIDANRTRVRVEMSYDTEGILEDVGDLLGFLDRRVDGDLERFKAFIEERGSETGGYRETLQNPKAPGGHTRGDPGLR